MFAAQTQVSPHSVSSSASLLTMDRSAAAQLDCSSMTAFSESVLSLDAADLRSLASWNWSAPAQRPFVSRCGAQFYPQTLRVDGVAYLRVLNVLLTHSVDGELVVWMFAANPFADAAHAQKLTQRLLTATQRLLCVFSAAETVLSARIQPPFHFDDFYAVVECKVPRALRPWLRHMVDSKHWFTPLQLALVDPFALCSATGAAHDLSFIALPVCPNYPFNGGRGLHSAALEAPASPDSKEQRKAHELGVCVVLRPRRSDLYAAHDDGAQVALKVHEWMEFARHMTGADHFYVFLHVRPEAAGGAELRWFWERVAAPFLSVYGADALTLIEWPQRYDARFAFQTAALNSCARQFAADNELLLAIDVDEMVVPTIENRSLADVVRRVRSDQRVWSVHCDLIGVTCPERWRQCDARFSSFAARHECVLNLTRWRQQRGDARIASQSGVRSVGGALRVRALRRRLPRHAQRLRRRRARRVPRRRPRHVPLPTGAHRRGRDARPLAARAVRPRQAEQGSAARSARARTL